MAYLAKVARADGIAVILQMKGEGYATYVAHNLATDTKWSGGLPAVMLAKAMSERATDQATSGVTLALLDGRTADTLAVSPVIWKDQVVGGLAALLVGRAFSAEDLAGLGRVGDLIGLELAEANALWRAQRQGQDAEAKLKATRDLQAIIRKERNPDQLLERATAQLAEVFGADGVSIMLIDDEGKLAVRTSHGLSEEAQRERKSLGEGISGGVAKSGQPMLLSGPVAGGSDPSASEAMIVPLRVGDRTIGVVNVKHHQPQQKYTQVQVDTLSLVAQDIASAYSISDELQRAEEDRQQAIVLFELSRFATLGSDPQQDLPSAVAMLAGTLHHDAASVWQLDNGDRLHLRAATGYELGEGAEIPVDEADTTLATVLREKHAARERISLTDTRPDWAAPGCTQFLLAPIASLGVVIFARATEPYSNAEVDFTTTVAEYLVGMLQKSSAQDVVDRGVSTERRRIAQEIHDGLAQELTGVVLALEGCQRALEKDPSLLGPQLTKAARDARATLADVRQYMAALRQSETGALNLPVTLGRLVDDLRRQTGLQVEMDESGPQQELEPIVERAVIRIVGEALRNVAQHAGAQKAKVSLQYGPEGVVVTIEDDGRGFDVEQTFTSAEGRGHFGVIGMRERAEAAGGQLVVRSEAGHGTIVRASIPYSNMATVPGLAGPIEDVEQQAGVDDQATSDRGGFLGRLFGR